MKAFTISDPLPTGRTSLEASAGTGKTWTIAALATRFVAEGVAPLDQLLIVTFTRAATAELRSRIRDRLVGARAHLRHAIAAGEASTTSDSLFSHLTATTPAEWSVQADRLGAAVRDFDGASITTIHGFCQRVLAAAGFAGDVGGVDTLVEEVDTLVEHHVHDLLIGFFHDLPITDLKTDVPSEARATKVVAQVLANPSLVLRPPADDDPDEPVAARALNRLAAQSLIHIDAHKRQQAIATFDDLLIRLEAALGDPSAATAIREAMARAFSVAMIDEFQDTDPIQWSILETLFGDRPLVLIGDPKQAIYAFRGADVQAYVDAVRTAPASPTLARNFRSDGRLITALNRLFEGVEFGASSIAYQRVDPAHAADRIRFADHPRPPLQIRALTDRDLKADPAREIIAVDLVAQIAELLDSPPAITRDDGTVDDLQAGDCAVLVRSNVQAHDVKAALTDAGIHAVINGVGSVLDTDAAKDWGLLLDALDRPSSAGAVRAVALSPIVGMTAAELATMDDVADAALHGQVHGWSRTLAEHGVAALARGIAQATKLHPRVLAVIGGDRWIADFEHVAELLHAATQGESMSPTALHTWLSGPAEEDEAIPSDQLARRLESDARAVQILTIHRAKGLEFPVVFVPFLSGLSPYPQVPHLIRGADGRELDLGSQQVGQAKALAQEEWFGEHLRLLYVALTRAKHRLVVWWWPHSSAHKVALTKVLFAENEGDDSSRVTHAEMPKIKDETGQAAALDRLRKRLSDAAEVVEVDEAPTAERREDGWDTEPADLVARQYGGLVDWRWRRTSFSSLVKARQSTKLVPTTPDVVDMVTDEDDHARFGRVPAAEAAGHQSLPLGVQPAGAPFGTFLHAVIEHTDLAAADLTAAVREQVDRLAPSSGVRIDDPDGLVNGLVLACRTPLGTPFDDAALAGIERVDRLDELDFDLPLAHGGSQLTLAAIGDLLQPHAGEGPLSGWVARLRDRTPVNHVRGFLGGSIDLVWRRQTADGPVFHVVDHKSNRLFGYEVEGSTWHYRPAGLVEAMQHSDYLLQALLYRVALHRYLRWRQPGYDPRRHLGAVGYTFLRGMVGPEAPTIDGQRCGVFAWQPPDGLTDAMSDLLEAGT